MPPLAHRMEGLDGVPAAARWEVGALRGSHDAAFGSPWDVGADQQQGRLQSSRCGRSPTPSAQHAGEEHQEYAHQTDSQQQQEEEALERAVAMQLHVLAQRLADVKQQLQEQASGMMQQDGDSVQAWPSNRGEGLQQGSSCGLHDLATGAAWSRLAAAGPHPDISVSSLSSPTDPGAGSPIAGADAQQQAGGRVNGSGGSSIMAAMEGCLEGAGAGVQAPHSCSVSPWQAGSCNSTPPHSRAASEPSLSAPRVDIQQCLLRPGVMHGSCTAPASPQPRARTPSALDPEGSVHALLAAAITTAGCLQDRLGAEVAAVDQLLLRWPAVEGMVRRSAEAAASEAAAIAGTPCALQFAQRDSGGSSTPTGGVRQALPHAAALTAVRSCCERLEAMASGYTRAAQPGSPAAVVLQEDV